MPTNGRTLAKLLIIATSVLVLAAGSAQQRPETPRGRSAEFHFARMIYTDLPRYRRFGRGWWAQDWPDAEVHFRQGIERLTRIDTGRGVTLELFDESLFDYPWLYATQVGYWDLSDAEVERLREYLLRGGFLMVDDFFDEYEWLVFQESMGRLFPGRPIVDLVSRHDEVLHVLYDIERFVQIPGLRHLGRFGRGRARLPEPQLRGIYDDAGRLVVAINFAMDVGDAWEHADDPYYPEPMTALAYRFGINYVIYAMTH